MTPVSRKRDKGKNNKKKENKNKKKAKLVARRDRPTVPRSLADADRIQSIEELKPLAASALSKIPVGDLDSTGLAAFYYLYAPNDQLNQCLMASGTLYLARKSFGLDSEIVPAVLTLPWANEQWGTPEPKIRADGSLDGHVVLVTDKGILLDVTAAQFPSLNAKRNGLPIVGRDPRLWADLCSPEVIEDPRTHSRVVVYSSPSEMLAQYDLYSPILASGPVMNFISIGGRQLAVYLANFVEKFAWILANAVLIEGRRHEIELIPSAELRRRVRAAVGTQLPPTEGLGPSDAAGAQPR